MFNPSSPHRISKAIDARTAPLWRLFLFYFRFLFPVWHLILLVFFLVLIATAIDANKIFIPIMTRYMLDRVFPSQDWNLWLVLLFVTFAQIGLHHLVTTLTDVVKYIISFRMGMNFGMTAFRHLHNLSLSFIEKRPVGEHIYRVGTSFDPQGANLAWIGLIFDNYGSAAGEDAPRVGYDIDVVIGMVTQFLELVLRVFMGLLLIAGVVGLMIGPQIGLALIIFAVPYFIGVHYMYSLQRNTEGRIRHLSEEYLAHMQQTLAGIQTVKAYGKTRAHLLSYGKRFILLCRRQGWYYILKMLTDNYLNIMKWVFVAITYFYSVAYMNVSLGEGVALYMFMIEFFNPINQAVRVLQGIRIQMVAARRLMETLGARSDLEAPANPIPIGETKGPIALEKVDFHYIGEFPVLKNVDLTIEPGKKTVLVGPSGSGKSSMANLVLRFYDPVKGKVALQGIDLKEVDLVRYYDQVGMVLQDDFLFSGTIRDNIIYGKRLATQTEIEHACRIAGIHDEIMEMPDQYDTFVGEGSGLSGGQMQRIALARAFVRNPRIVMFDEATRALDARLRHLVLTNVDSEFKDSTRIMITHATNDAVNADQVIYLEQGVVKERGTYEELMARKGAFSAMVDAERGKELEEKPA